MLRFRLGRFSEKHHIPAKGCCHRVILYTRSGNFKQPFRAVTKASPSDRPKQIVCLCEKFDSLRAQLRYNNRRGNVRTLMLTIDLPSWPSWCLQLRLQVGQATPRPSAIGGGTCPGPRMGSTLVRSVGMNEVTSELTFRRRPKQPRCGRPAMPIYNELLQGPPVRFVFPRQNGVSMKKDDPWLCSVRWDKRRRSHPQSGCDRLHSWGKGGSGWLTHRNGCRNFLVWRGLGSRV